MKKHEITRHPNPQLNFVARCQNAAQLFFSLRIIAPGAGGFFMFFSCEAGRNQRQFYVFAKCIFHEKMCYKTFLCHFLSKFMFLKNHDFFHKKCMKNIFCRFWITKNGNFFLRLPEQWAAEISFHAFFSWEWYWIERIRAKLLKERCDACAEHETPQPARPFTHLSKPQFVSTVIFCLQLFLYSVLHFYFVDLWAVPDSEKCAIPLISWLHEQSKADLQPAFGRPAAGLRPVHFPIVK